MIKGIGTDLLEINRIAKVLARSPKIANRILTDREFADFSQSLQPARYLASVLLQKKLSLKP